LTANAIHTTDERELFSLFLEQFEVSLFVAVIVTNESAIGLFDSEHMEQLDRGMNLELAAIMRSTAVGDASRAEFEEVLWKIDSADECGVCIVHIFKVVES
jgi:hypothetical protein